MLDPTVEDFLKELRYVSERLDQLAKSCENAAWLSDADRALVRQVQREKDHLALRLLRIGNGDKIKAQFTGEWNKFLMDLDQLELRVEVDHAENAKQ